MTAHLIRHFYPRSRARADQPRSPICSTTTGSEGFAPRSENGFSSDSTIPEVIAADSVPDSPNIIPRTPPAAGGRVPVRTAFRRDLLPWFSQSAKRGYDEEESGEDLVNQLPRWTTEIYG